MLWALARMAVRISNSSWLAPSPSMLPATINSCVSPVIVFRISIGLGCLADLSRLRVRQQYWNRALAHQDAKTGLAVPAGSRKQSPSEKRDKRLQKWHSETSQSSWHDFEKH